MLRFNPSDANTEPRPPKGFKIEFDKDGWRHRGYRPRKCRLKSAAARLFSPVSANAVLSINGFPILIGKQSALCLG
jgi:hypothetical protein